MVKLGFVVLLIREESPKKKIAVGIFRGRFFAYFGRNNVETTLISKAWRATRPMWRECEGGRDGQAVGAYGRERQGAARHRQGFREAGGGRHLEEEAEDPEGG